MNADRLHGSNEERARLTLLATPGISSAKTLALLREHGSGSAAWRALRQTQPSIVAAAAARTVQDRVARTLNVVAREKIEMIWFDDARYPTRLAHRLDRFAPPVLFIRGDAALLAARAVAVVGCRQASNYGLDIAEQIGSAVGQLRGCVVSGLALGIDAAAQRAVLDAGGTTIGVLGCGVDVYYPREHVALQDRIASEGLLVSELLPGEPPLRHHFPHRNRIIAALSEVVVVVEATEKSGALKTAEHASAQGVDVFAVPNALDHPNFQGNLALIRDGAAVFTGVRPLLEHVNLLAVGAALPRTHDPAAEPFTDERQQRIWRELGNDARHIDAVAAAAGLTTADALVTLLALELEGRVRQLPGSRYTRATPRHTRVLSGAR